MDIIFELDADNVEDYWFRFHDTEQAVIIETLEAAIQQKQKVCFEISEYQFYDDFTYSLHSSEIAENATYQDPKALLEVIKTFE